MPVLYHNPRCSKSRQAVLMCSESALDVEIHLYLKEPLDYDTLYSMLERLQGDIGQAVRWNDKTIQNIDTTGIDANDIESVARFLSENGHFMERPWLDDGTVTMIGRPVENLARLL